MYRFGKTFAYLGRDINEKIQRTKHNLEDTSKAAKLSSDTVKCAKISRDQIFAL